MTTQVSNTPILEHIAATRLPILLSTGMSSLREIDDSVERIKAKGLPLTVLQYTSVYPTPPERAGLNIIPFFRKRYISGVGLSDHSGTIYAGLAAAAIGIDVLEVHVTFSRKMFGADNPVFLTVSELQQLVEGVRFIERARANPVDKDAVAEELKPMRSLFTKSIVARGDLPAGTLLREEHLAVKKPGTGIPAARLSETIGRTLLREMQCDEILQEHDLA